jgi:eukaryotic-like serine/threonine-protein kinase
MAQVFLGHDLLLARAVAVKVPLPHLASQEAASRRLHQEALAAARLSHPNVVAVYDTGTDGSSEFIVMELVDGISLRDRLATCGRLSVAEAVSIGTQVASALDFAHRAGIVHRDVKPGNILLTPDGRAKVTDFGIAKAIRDEDATQTGTTVGTARYLSPEQIDGRPLDGRADQYGLGVVLYEMLSGRVPFVGSNDVAVALGHLRQPPTPLRELRPELPEWLDTVVLRCLSKTPDDRFPSAGALCQALPAGPGRVEPGDLDPGGAAGGARTDEVEGVADGGPPTFPVAAAGHSAPTRRQDLGHSLDHSGRPTLTDRTSVDGVAGVPLVLDDRPAPGGRTGPTRRRRLVLLAVGIVALAGMAALGVVLAKAHSAPAPHRGDSSATASTQQALPIVGALSYNPEGTGPEDQSDLGNLFDGNPATVWHTEYYTTPHFGNLKNGTGFVLQLGQARKIGRLVVVTTTPGWTVEVYVARQVGPEVTDWGQPVASGTAASSTVSLSFPKTEGSDVLVWFTELGPAPPGTGPSGETVYQAVIGEATLYA